MLRKSAGFVHTATIAIMATYMPQHQPPIKPHQDFPSNTPPDQFMFQANNVPQRGLPAQNPFIGLRNHHKLAGDYRNNGATNTANGSKQPNVPTGPHGHMVNGGQRNYMASGGTAMFDGSRSPPTTKSMLCSCANMSFHTDC